MKHNFGRFFSAGLIVLLISSCSSDDATLTQCNDPFAQNYEASSTANSDCLFPTTTATIALVAELPNALREISGLAAFGDLLLGHNDQGNPAQLFLFNRLNGEIEHTIEVVSAPNIDWEDLAANEEYLYIGDFGNNIGNRDDLGIHRVAWSSFNIGVTNFVTADATIEFRFPDQVSFDQPDHNFDCEALFFWQEYLYFFTKHRADDRTNLYRIPATPGPRYDAEWLGGFNSGGRISGAGINADGSKVALIGYTKSGNCFVWLLSDFVEGDFLNGRKERLVIGPFSQFGQMEGIVFHTDSTLYIVGERVVETGLGPRLHLLSL